MPSPHTPVPAGAGGSSYIFKSVRLTLGAGLARKHIDVEVWRVPNEKRAIFSSYSSDIAGTRKLIRANAYETLGGALSAQTRSISTRLAKGYIVESISRSGADAQKQAAAAQAQLTNAAVASAGERSVYETVTESLRARGALLAL